ncbi:hypothetical protein CHELA1G2_60054 [Hyphomicrobiales bacterium]|nr:hypothetical protein CHELA1G2_60054 [Hyphomicrobiales bacterium]
MRDIVQPHPDLPGDQIIRCVPDAPAQARAEEIIHAWNAYRDAKHEQKAALGWDEADRAYDAALDQLEVAACALVDLLSPNIEAIRRKAETLAVIADWDLLAAEAKEASLGFDLRMAVSIARDIAGFFGLLETSTDVADATQIA